MDAVQAEEIVDSLEGDSKEVKISEVLVKVTVKKV